LGDGVDRVLVSRGVQVAIDMGQLNVEIQEGTKQGCKSSSDERL
jgi:hypothetical protein